MTSIPLQELPEHKGKVVGQSPWKNVSQETIQAFADATGDHQWIHVDVERARKEAPWGAPVAHGFLTLSLIPQLNQQAVTITGPVATINYGMNKVRLPAAVKSGSDIRSTVELLDVQDVDDKRVLATYRTTIEIKGEDKPAVVAENLAMYVKP
ncbi:Acyl dehydratase [Marinobacter daqiaonensis]|uniref:Acyl dehydratase n=1 Tax=Marinobacter daqiaonensis TaxID=650891 RepID=A0A1I6ILV7_9GAMM|nr:MaoC family dehydratase [Marinobacter daqiaonensis]SFR67708.1 Acyl dehydratase [Marinobacter daqiaonensis]